MVINYLETTELHPLPMAYYHILMLLEAIAVAYGFNPEGGSRNFNFSTMDSHSTLSDCIRLTKGVRKVQDGYFLRAESFYNVASNMKN